jgi:hypothetical protein
MQKQRTRSFWWMPLWFGLPLALLELSILFITVTYTAVLSPQRATLIGWSFYLIIPFAAGYQFCAQQRHEGWEGSWAAMRVAMFASALFLAASASWLLIAFIVYVRTPPPSYVRYRGIYSPPLDLLVSGLMLGVLALLAGIGALLGAVGGRIGGGLALWLSKPQVQGHEERE